MDRIKFCPGKNRYSAIIIFSIVLAVSELCFGSDKRAVKHTLSSYETWKTIGKFAAETSLNMISKAVAVPQTRDLVVLTNAGYAEVGMSPTQGTLDGLTAVTRVSRGRNTLVEIHSSFLEPLWFALFDKGSGFCAYLEVDSSEAVRMTKDLATPPSGLFSVRATERIDAEYLYEHSSEYKAKFDSKVFGGNEFRIIAIANAIAGGAPPDAVRAFEFHDHYCPGVASGILIARYLKAHFPPGKFGYFVHAVDPWCKEDALMVLLNATPGKRGYAVSYPTKADKAKRVPKAKNASTIVYRQNEQTMRWEGEVLGFEWAETSCRKTGNGIIDRLCTDLWYLEHMGKPENFVKIIKRFELPQGVSPGDWAWPGVDPLKMLGLVKEE